MSIKGISHSVQPFFPSSDQILNRFSTSLPKIAQNLSKVAIPAIALYALSNTSGAQAGGFFAGITYFGMTVGGGALIALGTVTAPVGGGALIAAGAASVTAAPYAAVVALGTPTP